MPKLPSKKASTALTQTELARLRELARHLVELERARPFLPSPRTFLHSNTTQLKTSLTTVSSGNAEIQKENAKLVEETESFNKLNADLVKSNNELEKRNLQLHETLFNIDDRTSQASIESPNISYRALSAHSQSSPKNFDIPGSDGVGVLSEKQKGKLPEKQTEKEENKRLADEGRWCEV